MPQDNVVAAVFPILRLATGAVDWFRNQAIDPQAIIIAAQLPDGSLRLPERGDNMRTDLKWVVGLNLDAVRFDKTVALDTLRREGGTLLKHIPHDLPVGSRR